MSQFNVVKCTYYCLHYIIYPAQCNPPCSPEGHCIEPNICACPSGLEGKQCEIGKHNCVLYISDSYSLVTIAVISCVFHSIITLFISMVIQNHIKVFVMPKHNSKNLV